MRTFNDIERDIREAEGIVNATNLIDVYDNEGNIVMGAEQRRAHYRYRLVVLQTELADLRRVFPHPSTEQTP